jgi:hypothetical protein
VTFAGDDKQLGALLSAVDAPLPRCREFSRALLRNDEERIAAQHTGQAALDELADIARGDVDRPGA